MAKSLFIFLFFSFSFLFSFGLTIQERSIEKYYITILHIIVTCQGCHRVTLHDDCGKVVHRPCNNCISSIQDLIGALLSSSCQLGLEV